MNDKFEYGVFLLMFQLVLCCSFFVVCLFVFSEGRFLYIVILWIKLYPFPLKSIF